MEIELPHPSRHLCTLCTLLPLVPKHWGMTWKLLMGLTDVWWFSESLVLQLTCSAQFFLLCAKENRAGRQMIWIDACFFVCIWHQAMQRFLLFSKIPAVFHFIIERAALRTAGALSRLLHKPLILPCFVSGKVTSAPCSRVSRTLKTMSPLITCLPSLNINTTCLEMSRRGTERKKAPFASKQ